MSLIKAQGAGDASTGFYDFTIDQSLRFEDGDSAYLSRTPSSATNRTTWTWSVWIKRGNLSYSSANMFGAYYDADDFEYVRFDSDDCIRYTYYVTGSVQNLLKTSASFRDTSAWYHILVQRDGSSSEIYVNGVQQDLQTETRASTNGYFNHTVAHNIGRFGGSGQHFDGYMAEMHFVDGTSLDPTSFGETKAGIWIPKNYTGSHGTNGFRLTFDSTHLNTSGSDITDPNGSATDLPNNSFSDASGSGNHFEKSTNVASTDIVLDSPTNNWCTINPVSSRGTQSEGNLKTVTEGSGYSSTVGSMGHTSGKWYWEVNVNTSSTADCIGVVDDTLDSLNSGSAVGFLLGNDGVDSICYYTNGSRYLNGVNAAYGASYTTGDIIGVALNLDDNELTFYKNGASQGAISHTFSGNHILPAVSDATNSSSAQATFTFNFGQDSSFAGTETAQGNADSNGVGDFYYSPPSGFLALCTANLPDPGIDPAQDEEPADHFNTVLYAGNNSTNNITGVGFQPDFVWLKNRSSGSTAHRLYDSVRGPHKALFSTVSNAEFDESSWGLDSFDSDGFTLLHDNTNKLYFNQTGQNYVAWNWLAGGSASSNSDGSITSSVSANTKAGFSIVSYTGTASADTVGHGLSQAPELVIWKDRETAVNWLVQGDIMGAAASGYIMLLNNTGSSYANSNFNTTLGASTITLDAGGTNYNGSGKDTIAYCFHSVDGYSKIGSYFATSSSDGPFVYLGFRPAFIFIKGINRSTHWIMQDNRRPGYNQTSIALFSNLSNAESTDRHVDFLSNGFKLRLTALDPNTNTAEYIYLAFAEQPFKYSNAR